MQIIDANGNMFGGGSLEVIGADGKPKVPSSAATLIVNSTPITGGTAGRILFEGTGNVLQESANLFWDQVNNRLGIGTTTPSQTLDVNGNIRSNSLIYATAGVYTGTVNANALASNGGNISIIGSGTTGIVLFQSTRNVVIQNGGTFTDAGFRVDVNGTARIQGETTIGNGTDSVIRANSASVGNFNTIQLIANTSNNSTMFEVRPNGTSTNLTGFLLRDSSTAAANSNVVIIGRGNATLPSTGVSYYGTLVANNVNANSLHLGFLVSSVSLGRIEAARIWNSGNVTIQNGGTFTDEASARLSINSTTQGVLIPRMTTTQRDAITSPAIGLQIFNTTTSCVEYYDTFWGWMPVNANSQWYANNGIDYFSDGIGSDDIVFSATNSGAGTGLNTGANILGRGQGNTTFILGTTTNGAAGIFTRTPFILGNGRIVNEYGFQRNAASTPAERYYAIFGFFDVFGAPNQIDGAYFLYDEGGVSSGSTASPNWQCVTSSNNVRTFTTTSVVVVGSYTKLRIEVNDAGTQVLFYINGTLVATHTTNIPTGTTRSVNWGTVVQKQVGTTSLQTFVVDYYLFKQKFTTPR